MREFDLLVFIGRFQPPHAGHVRVIETALERAERVLLLCGSADQPRTLRDPWSFEERCELIQSALDAPDERRVVLRRLRDILYDGDRWIASAQAIVASVAGGGRPRGSAPVVGLIGACGGGSAYYTRRFPGWDPVGVAPITGVSGSAIRRRMFEDRAKRGLEDLAGKVAPAVLARLEAFTCTTAFADLERDADFVERYRAAWADAPFTPVFVTVDAVVVQSGHVLLVRRGREPGRGLLALPGGFVDAGERLQQACVRELREETCIDLDDRVLSAAIRRREVFDEPYRSARGRIITHVFKFVLEPAPALPAVAGADDAEQAVWTPLSDLDPRVFFEDHYAILQVMLGMP